ncbi:MAG: hypothetical protein KC933_14640 [Myxococcales bacterium]|nr:hypothetical protein [Myxococcales bacterium]
MNGLAFLLTASALTAAGPTPDLGFLPNVGQAPPQVAFIAPTPGGAVWVGDDGALSIGPVTQRVVGGPLDPRAGDLGPTRVSLSLPGALAADIPTYSTVLLGEPHPGLRAQVSLRGGRPELIFILAPGARSDGIRVAVEGQIDLAVNARGELVIATVEGPLVLAPPTVWQDGEARAARYTVRDGEYGVSVPEYDHSRPLLIDPLYKAAYLGGAGDDRLVALLIPSDPAHPHRGKPHLVARTTSMDLVDPSGAVSAHTDVLVARMSTDLKTVEQAHILGGSGDDDVFTAAFHPASQQLILAGVTESTDLVPASMAAPQPQPGGYDDGFVAALSPDLGTLERVTYLGGAGMERVTGLAMNTMEGDPRFGLIYVCGNTNSDDLPQRFNGAIPVRAGILDAFVTRFAADLSAMHVSTYIGGASGSESYVTVAVSPHDGAVLLKGVTNSWMDDFPVTANAVQPAFGGGAPGTTDLFLARFDANLATLETATYLGGDALEEHGYEPIAFAPFGTDVFLGGTTMSSNFPDVVLGTRGDRDAFVIRMDGALTQIYGGVAVGGSNADLLYEMLLAPGAESEVILVGLTGSPDLPGTEGAPQTTYGGGAGDLFVARLAPGLQEVRRLTYLGGTGREGAAMMALDATRDALVVAGYTDSSGWDALAAGPQPRLSFGLDSFVVRLSRTLDEREGGTYFGWHRLTMRQLALRYTRTPATSTSPATPAPRACPAPTPPARSPGWAATTRSSPTSTQASPAPPSPHRTSRSPRPVASTPPPRWAKSATSVAPSW